LQKPIPGRHRKGKKEGAAISAKDFPEKSNGFGNVNIAIIKSGPDTMEVKQRAKLSITARHFNK